MCVGLGMGGTVIWENPHYGSDSENDAAELTETAVSDDTAHTTAGSTL
jgi:hypothetical protein